MSIEIEAIDRDLCLRVLRFSCVRASSSKPRPQGPTCFLNELAKKVTAHSRFVGFKVNQHFVLSDMRKLNLSTRESTLSRRHPVKFAGGVGHCIRAG